MKKPALPVFSVLLALTTSPAATPRTGGNYSQSTETFAAAGGTSTSVHYSHTVSVGGLGAGISTFGPSAVAKNGFAGQLYQVTKLKLTASATTVDEGGSSLLDNSILMLASNLWDGDKHGGDQMPIVLAGGAGGTMKTGRVLDYLDKGNDNRKACSMYLSIMERMGVKLDRFGDADKPLENFWSTPA